MKISVSGEQFVVVAEVDRNYVKKRWKTAKEYDLNAGTYDEVSEKLIKSTRVFSSRISKVECEWFG